MKTILSLALVCVLSLSLTSVAFAQLTAPSNPFYAPLTSTTNIGAAATSLTQAGGIANTVLNLVNWFAWFVAVIAVIMGLYAGYLFITGGGDPGKLSTARSILLYAIIGVAVAILAFSVIAISRAVLNI